MQRIDRITLADVIPSVFVGDSEHESATSGLWRKTFTFDRGACYCIDAASGTGKTSLCSFLYGVRRDYEGRIMFNGTDIRSYGIREWCELRRRHLSYLPQELDVFGELTSIDNVMLKNRLTDFRTESEIRKMFQELEIDNRTDTPAGRMSVGQRQRVALIRALCQPFDYIILDEPVSHLDSLNNRKCAEMVAAEAARQQAAVVYTSVGNPLALDSIHIINVRL